MKQEEGQDVMERVTCCICAPGIQNCANCYCVRHGRRCGVGEEITAKIVGLNLKGKKNGDDPLQTTQGERTVGSADEWCEGVATQAEEERQDMDILQDGVQKFRFWQRWPLKGRGNGYTIHNYISLP